MRKPLKFLMTMVVASLAAASTVSAADKLEVPVATWGSPNHINISTFVGKLQELLAQEDGGRISIKHFPSGQLAEDADMPVAIPSGNVKFGWVTLNGWSGVTQDVKIADAPAGLTMQQLEKATDGQNGLKAVLDKQFRKKGTTLLAVTPLGPAVFVTNQPALSPSDFKGKKIRVFSEGLATLTQALGGAPVKLPFADVYTALQRGTIDGAIVGFQGVASQKMYEVVKYLLIPASFTGAGGYQGWAANAAWWDGLAQADRAILSKAIREAELYSRQKIVEDRENLADFYRGKDMTVVELTPDMPEYAQWVAVTKPLMETAEKELSAEILAPIRAVQGK
ncbi:MAG: TRAP transporter substrate-binding protein DctP [Candidatus Competibacteraceae bacterium]|nr:TRAP transporter substrate-binding protein DctP [Candidatus Competibacteraceae bacterium]